MRNANANPACGYNASLSLSGCGFMCIYHIGVCAAMKEYIPQLLQNRISGASAGSIIAAGVISNVCISQAMSFFVGIVSEARSYTFGTLNRDFDLMKLVRTKLNALLPSDAHELCTGRLRVSVTRFCDMKNVILDEFCTKDELIDALCCSCFIPVYGGFIYPTFRGEIYIDGGASDNQPVLDIDTIIVSPFSGESDICPTDRESASLFEWNFGGTSIRLTANNLYRTALCLFPPSAEECIAVYRSGFNDALKFLVNNGFISNSVCQSVKAGSSFKFYQINESFGVSSLPNSDMHQESYANKQIAGYVDVVFASCSTQLPYSKQSTFDEPRKKNWLLDYISSFRIFHLVHYMTLPLSASYKWFRFCQCLSAWLSERIIRNIADELQSVRVKNILDFILYEISAQESKVSARFSQQLAITEVELSGASEQNFSREKLNIGLSSEAIKERELLKNVDRLFSKTTSSSVKVNSLTAYSVNGKLPFFNASLHMKEQGTSVGKTSGQIIEHTKEYDVQ